MTVVSISQAKTRFSELVAAAERGDEVVITRRGKPVARLVALAPTAKRGVVLGRFDGQGYIHPSFDDDMTEEELSDWYGSDDDDSSLSSKA